jgi:hypothetical protein
MFFSTLIAKHGVRYLYIWSAQGSNTELLPKTYPNIGIMPITYQFGAFGNSK